MGLDVPWYSALDSIEALLAGRPFNKFYLVTYLRDGDRVFETYWTRGRAVEIMAPAYRLLDLRPAGRSAGAASSATPYIVDGRPIAQWPRLRAGHTDDLGNAAS